MPIVRDFFKTKSIQTNERDWFCQELPDTLKKLRRERNWAEHESGGQLMRHILVSYWNEFMGIGQQGVIVRSCKILFQTANNQKKTSG